MGEYGIGQSVPREEDPYLLRGAGRYVDDVVAETLDQARDAAEAITVEAVLAGFRSTPR